MKKIIGIVALVMVISLASAVFASSEMTVRGTKISVVEKDVVTWQPIFGGANGEVEIIYNIPSITYRQYKYRSTLLTDSPVCPNALNETECAEIIANADTVVRNSITHEQVRAKIYGAEPMIKYQLILYGDTTHNDEWPYITCIGPSVKTSSHGYTKNLGGRFVPSGVGNQKLWVVPASDVDCNNGVMTNWDPTRILFEDNLI